MIVGLWAVGDKRRGGFLLACLGELIWVVHALMQEAYDMAFICGLCAVIAGRNWWAWRE